jgi:hypothetical protein
MEVNIPKLPKKFSDEYKFEIVDGSKILPKAKETSVSGGHRRLSGGGGSAEGTPASAEKEEGTTKAILDGTPSYHSKKYVMEFLPENEFKLNSLFSNNLDSFSLEKKMLNLDFFGAQLNIMQDYYVVYSTLKTEWHHKLL